jgi:hypothetical protein
MFLLIFSCKLENKPTEQEQSQQEEPPVTAEYLFPKESLLDLWSFSIVVPSGWRTANPEFPPVADATYRKEFYNKQGKRIFFVHGLSAYDPTSKNYVVRIYKREHYKKNHLDTSHVVFSDDPFAFTKLVDSNHISYIEKISGYVTKIFMPKKNGNGFSGMYIDSTGLIAGEFATFSVWAKDLSSTETEELIRAIKTIKIKSLDSLGF